MRLTHLSLCLVLLAFAVSPALAESSPGVAAYEREDFKAALPLLEKEAATGDPIAQTKLGLIHAKGLGVEKDPKIALKWFEKAAAQGHAEAEYCVGVVYDIGDGLPKDPATAVKWYRKAAEKGLDKAQFNLASMLREGSGTAIDLKEAASWYRKAAHQGFDDAQFVLARLYVAGEGVDQSLLSGKMWMDRAAAQGGADPKKGKEIIDRVFAKMVAAGEIPVLAGGDGSSAADAISFPEAKNESNGVRSEHQVMQALLPNWQWGTQHLVNSPDGHLYDMIEISKGGETRELYFDIANWFGKME